MATAGVSQASSPRLPSPPPFTEVQIGPKSPSVGESFDSETEQLLGASQTAEDGSTRRIRPGTRAIDMAFGPPLIPLSQLDSPFQLQEHLKALYNHFTRPEGSDTIIPISRDVAIQLAEPPEGVDRSLWLYELCRFLTMKVNNLIVAFFADSPPCSAQTCPEMRASEWQYLCAVHDPPKACCAIDYCCHTLDWATNILTSPKYFPSRLTLGAEGGGGAQASMRHLTNIFRRLYRIFAHAWFQHREVFWQVEGHDGLYIFFKTVCDMYSLIPEDNYTVPAEAEGLDTVQQQQQPAAAAAAGATTGLEHGDGRRVTILRKENEPFPVSMEPVSISTGATTRRHKGSSSISSGVTTINESAEDDEQPKQQAVAAATAAVAAAAAAAGGQSKPQSALQATEEPKQAAEQTSPGSPASQVTVAEVHAEEPEPAPQTETDTEPEPEPESKAEKNAEAAGEAAEEAAEEEQPKEAEAEAKHGAEEASTEEHSTEEPTAAEESSTETTEAEPTQKE
ncbi:Mob1 family protein [Aspergillus brunneoviolaceus CBS 621.78]|uniref:Mob1/phocein n=1 Tax=Aspergillus brunneoviolaceus CBS 621.78 TaxID=1450534 RepID=A0ACD1G8P7_9EURO|nr:Mob1/phocein [Aspergillus brunneoviolaceus CBS 621.78]RAH45659.1 Mob1/phocein [Aspergillus brunneoviolaceus CBS 621.78]